MQVNQSWRDEPPTDIKPFRLTPQGGDGAKSDDFPRFNHDRLAGDNFLRQNDPAIGQSEAALGLG
jgi:hypothetical protein